MSLNMFKLPGVDTRLIKGNDTVYKLRVIMASEIPCDMATFQREIESFVRAIIVMQNMQPIKSDHLLAIPKKKVWKSCNLMRFSERKKQLNFHPFIYEIRLRKLPNVSLPSNEKKAEETYIKRLHQYQPIDGTVAETALQPAEPKEGASYSRDCIDRHEIEDQILKEDRRLQMLSTPRNKKSILVEERRHGGFVHSLLRAAMTPVRLLFGNKK
ncbi:uncharacterized protein LOC117104439 [Anneissia japonica]|uniref:uncharacterized protein LOC117104439 n=1 Tax=Anneissia japonica TaxID=1529436 RepID=UPI0014256B7F|nr:uncharacterized protein LOC117104439 [Anneissia japonica]XP_033101185.1 uncharacterized protein LOC117104439 [Anneissia japonica]XP_033101186.1 uncharacterized protein LOC117104439 [Anneissia japonica]XP_033101187.1 uncharacterized protein LOC117104439 [Anneissia japonica]